MNQSIKYKRIGFIFAISIVCALFGGGCREKTEEKSVKLPSMKVGVLMYKKDDTFIASLVSYFESYAKEKEQSQQIKVTVNTLDGKGNQTTQNDQIDKMVAQSCDVLCINLVDRTAAASVIDKAKSANIPIVFFNREPVKEDLERWEKVYYVGALATESGALQGQIIVDAYKEAPYKIDKNGDNKLQYVMLEGEQSHQDTLLRAESSVKSIVSSGIQMEKLANDTANWQRSQATTKMSQWIKKFGDEIEVVLCNNDDMALGAIDAYEGEKITQLPAIVGIDGTEAAILAMKDKKLLGTVHNNAKGQAEAMFDLCYALTFHKDVQKAVKLKRKKYVLIPYEKVENIEEHTEEAP